MGPAPIDAGPIDAGPNDAGLRRCITDIEGLSAGHYQRRGRGWATGTTVVRCSPTGAIAGVDVRGAAPGTRETDLLRPDALVERVHAICLTGGSAYGLAAADGVMSVLERDGIGFPVGGTRTPPWFVPIVPAAVIFDLGRGGSVGNRPNPDFGDRAARAARHRALAQGAVGAGTGAASGGLQGGVGTWSLQVGEITVAALAVVNSIGSAFDPVTACAWQGAGELGLRAPSAADVRRFHEATQPAVAAESPLNTTIGVVATDAVLTKAECVKLAAVAHDGLARAIRPAHTMFDGDTIFSLSTERIELRGPAAIEYDGRAEAARRARASALSALLTAAADTFAVACTRAVVSAAQAHDRPAYREVCPSAFR